MLDSVTQPAESRIYEVRSESPAGRVHAFGARRKPAEAEVLLAESISKVQAAGGRHPGDGPCRRAGRPGFYVPDWWDLHDGKKLPGSMYWQQADDEWPAGDFGFGWGCIWGDDSSWKVQYLDLSRVADGAIHRDDRFGYLKLATDPKLVPRDFIRCSSRQGERHVDFYIESRYNLATGARIAGEGEDW
jgi:hypothetical protein